MNESNFEESVQKRDIVCPFLKRGLEQGEGSVDAGSIFAVGFVLVRRVISCQVITIYQSSHPAIQQICKSEHGLTGAELVPPLSRGVLGVTNGALRRGRPGPAWFKGHFPCRKA